MFRSGLETQVHFRDIRLNIKGVGRRVYRPQNAPLLPSFLTFENT